MYRVRQITKPKLSNSFNDHTPKHSRSKSTTSSLTNVVSNSVCSNGDGETTLLKSSSRQGTRMTKRGNPMSPISETQRAIYPEFQGSRKSLDRYGLANDPEVKLIKRKKIPQLVHNSAIIPNTEKTKDSPHQDNPKPPRWRTRASLPQNFKRKKVITPISTHPNKPLSLKTTTTTSNAKRRPSPDLSHDLPLLDTIKPQKTDRISALTQSIADSLSSRIRYPSTRNHEQEISRTNRTVGNSPVNRDGDGGSVGLERMSSSESIESVGLVSPKLGGVEGGKGDVMKVVRKQELMGVEGMPKGAQGFLLGIMNKLERQYRGSEYNVEVEDDEQSPDRQESPTKKPRAKMIRVRSFALGKRTIPHTFRSKKYGNNVLVDPTTQRIVVEGESQSILKRLDLFCDYCLGISRKYGTKTFFDQLKNPRILRFVNIKLEETCALVESVGHILLQDLAAYQDRIFSVKPFSLPKDERARVRDERYAFKQNIRLMLELLENYRECTMIYVIMQKHYDGKLYSQAKMIKLLHHITLARGNTTELHKILSYLEKPLRDHPDPSKEKPKLTRTNTIIDEFKLQKMRSNKDSNRLGKLHSNILDLKHAHLLVSNSHLNSHQGPSGLDPEHKKRIDEENRVVTISCSKFTQKLNRIYKNSPEFRHLDSTLSTARSRASEVMDSDESLNISRSSLSNVNVSYSPFVVNHKLLKHGSPRFRPDSLTGEESHSTSHVNTPKRESSTLPSIKMVSGKQSKITLKDEAVKIKELLVKMEYGDDGLRNARNFIKNPRDNDYINRYFSPELRDQANEEEESECSVKPYSCYEGQGETSAATVRM